MKSLFIVMSVLLTVSCNETEERDKKDAIVNQELSCIQQQKNIISKIKSNDSVAQVVHFLFNQSGYQIPICTKY